jgi:hypothetical protein
LPRRPKPARISIGGARSVIQRTIGAHASVEILGVTVADSTTKALIVASGSGAVFGLVDTTISGGTLKTSAGGKVVAFTMTLSGVTVAASSLTATLVGNYSLANFSSSTMDGHFTITDPGIVSGGSGTTETVKASIPHSGIDLPDIAFGAQTTLAYAENSTDTGGTLTVTDERHAASIALLGNYMAGSFLTAADGHGGTLVTEASQTAPPLLLTHPRA